LTEVSRFVDEIGNLSQDHRTPYVGESAFAHKGGAHIDAMMKNPQCYEHIDPTLVGNERQYLMSQQAGGSTVVHKLQRVLPGIDKRDPRVAALLERVKNLEHEGYAFEAANGSFDVLAHRVVHEYEEPFEVVAWRTISRHGNGGDQPSDTAHCESEAIVKLMVRGVLRHTVASGDGPVDALNRALRKALRRSYPGLDAIRLADYKVRDLSAGEGTAAKVRVLIESRDQNTGQIWGTVGVSENILEASWEALLDSFRYKLLLERREAESA